MNVQDAQPDIVKGQTALKAKYSRHIDADAIGFCQRDFLTVYK